MSAASAVAHVLAQPTTSAYTVTAGRFWSLVAALVGLAGVVIGGLVLARAGSAAARTGAVAALAAGLVGALIGGLVVGAAEGGPGTGSGIVGGFAAVVVGLIGTALGALGLARSRRTRPS